VAWPVVNSNVLRPTRIQYTVSPFAFQGHLDLLGMKYYNCQKRCHINIRGFYYLSPPSKDGCHGLIRAVTELILPIYGGVTSMRSHVDPRILLDRSNLGFP
jgi:hypothetical protein